jgi:hypothetical protein
LTGPSSENVEALANSLQNLVLHSMRNFTFAPIFLVFCSAFVTPGDRTSYTAAPRWVSMNVSGLVKQLKKERGQVTQFVGVGLLCEQRGAVVGLKCEGYGVGVVLEVEDEAIVLLRMRAVEARQSLHGLDFLPPPTRTVAF